MTTLVVLTQSLTKRYGRLAALEACSLRIEAGEIYGLLGPNGSGKTTLIRLLMGYLKPSDGSASVFDLDCHRQSVAIHQRVAYLPGEIRLFRRMRSGDVLQFLSQLHPRGDLDRANALAKRLDVDLKRRVSQCSTGMRQKLALAAVLSVDADLLILDEPTSNLDPSIRQEVLSLLKEARESGKAVIFSSHVLVESEQVCDRVAILRHGHLVHVQTVNDLTSRHRVQARLAGAAPQVPASLTERIEMKVNADQLSLTTDADLSLVLGWLASLPLSSIRIESLGLQSVYDRYHAKEER